MKKGDEGSASADARLGLDDCHTLGLRLEECGFRIERDSIEDI
jgi:hypothetical protein